MLYGLLKNSKMVNMSSREAMKNILQDVHIVFVQGPPLIMDLFMQKALLIVEPNGLLLGISLLEEFSLQADNDKYLTRCFQCAHIYHN
jgi:hypothetical protein